MKSHVVVKRLSPLEKRAFEEYLGKKQQKIADLVSERAPDGSHLRVMAEKFPTNAAYKVALELHIGKRILYAYEDAHDPHSALDMATEKLLRQIKRMKELRRPASVIGQVRRAAREGRLKPRAA